MASKYYNTFWCDTCAGIEIGGPEAIQAHLKAVHNIGSVKGNRTPLMHVDSRDSFTWSYEWTIGKVKLHQETCQRRAKDDPMRYA